MDPGWKNSGRGSRIRNTGCLICEGWRTLGWSTCPSCTCPGYGLKNLLPNKKPTTVIQQLTKSRDFRQNYLFDFHLWYDNSSATPGRQDTLTCLKCEGWRTLGWSTCLSCTCPAFLTPGSRDPGWIKSQDLDPGSGIRNEQPGSYFLELRSHFLGLFSDADPGSGMEKLRIRDGKNVGSGIRINILDPQHGLFNMWRLTNTRLEHVPELHLPGLLSLDLSANYLADLDCAALENLAQARPHCNRKLVTNIPRKGIAWPRSQFPHSCVCERFIYSHDRSAYSAAGNIRLIPGNI